MSRLNASRLIDVNYKYKQIAEEFCKYYYNIYDNDFKKLASTFHPDAQFTLNNLEIGGFENYNRFLEQNGTRKFEHHDVIVSCQPIGDSNLILTVHGTMSINDSIFVNKFMETLFIQRNEFNRFYVFSCMLKIFE